MVEYFMTEKDLSPETPLLTELEDYLKEKIFPDLEEGRPGWDKPHTEAVVQKIKDIIENVEDIELDTVVLVVAAYAHDWGCASLFDGGEVVQLEEIGDRKIAHMVFGAERLSVLLEDEFFNFMSKEQKERAVHLVAIHDYLDRLKDLDELILMEADTLGVIDVDLVKPTFNQESNAKWVKRTKKMRVSKFVTDYSKREAERLSEKRKVYYESLSGD